MYQGNTGNVRPDYPVTSKEIESMKKHLLVVLMIVSLVMSTALFAAGSKEAAAEKEVYFLNFKPEIADVYETKIAPAFEAETGIKLKVVTAASGTYAQTLKSEIAKSNPPVIFQTNGPVGMKESKGYSADLTNTGFYKILSDKSMALTDEGKVLAVPYAVEGYGIIYNDAIMRKYFALSSKAVSINSADEIRNFATLKAVVEDMTKHKSELGIQGVFASTSLSAGNQWRWQTHLVNVPLHFELRDANIAAGSKVPEIKFTYSANMKNIWDLYLNNSTTAVGLLGSKSVDDSMAEFALGQAAMVQNGNWGASQILGVKGNKVADADIKFLPIYTGIAGEEKSGLNVGTENYLCINSNASAEQQAMADQFLTWLFSSDTGKQFVKNDLMFITPFNTFKDDELPTDPLAKEVIRWMNQPGVTSVPWAFSVIPSEEWKNQFGAALAEYSVEKKTWAQVESVAVEAWKTEYALTN
jgi:raffinose/stachyose/melibiose transport system substrate-binding protein